MSHLTSAETKSYFYFVTLLDELSCCIYLRVQIVLINIRRQANFFDFDGLLFTILTNQTDFSVPDLLVDH